MKKIIALIFIATAFISLSASAQKPAGGRMALSKQELMDSLKVSDAVADSVIAVRTESMTQMRSVMSDQSLTQDQKKEKMQPLRQDMKTKLKKFLTDEQLQKMQQMDMDKRGKMGGTHGDGGSSNQ